MDTVETARKEGFNPPVHQLTSPYTDTQTHREGWTAGKNGKKKKKARPNLDASHIGERRRWGQGPCSVIDCLLSVSALGQAAKGMRSRPSQRPQHSSVPHERIWREDVEFLIAAERADDGGAGQNNTQTPAPSPVRSGPQATLLARLEREHNETNNSGRSRWPGGREEQAGGERKRKRERERGARCCAREGRLS